MRAMIFAAGVGSRLGSITKDLPKCLVEAGGQTMLEHVVERLKSAGVRAIMINLHHHADQICAFVKSRNSFGIDVQFSNEETLLNTGGGLKAAQDFFSDQKDFFVHNCDVYSDIDLAVLLRAHRQHQAIATLAVMRRKSDRQLVFDQQLNLLGWRNLLNGQEQLSSSAADTISAAFSGIQVVSPALFQTMQQQSGSFGIISSYLLAVERGQSVKGSLFDNSFWIDIGTPEKLQELQLRLQNG